MSHTIGPWRVGDAGTTIFGPPNGSPAPQTIATMRQGKNWMSNAKLIAAAPDLLEALESLEIWASMMGGWEAPCWNQARLAIAKATE